MSRGEPNERRLSRLLWRKQRLARTSGTSAPRKPETPELEFESQLAPATCLNCGYDLRAQVVDRCPECGLLLALGYRDSTAWARTGPGPRAWCLTWMEVCGWSLRTRIRTSLVPTTADTRRFALWCMVLTSGLLGLASGIEGAARAGTPAAGLGLFLLHFLTTGCLALLLLVGTLHGMAAVLTGRWRQFRFVPAAVHYACAWGPPTAIGLLLASALGTATGHPGFELAWYVVALAGITYWGIWVWASVTESGRHSWPSLRIASLTVSFAVLVCCALTLGPRSLQSIRVAFATAAARVKLGDTLSAFTRSQWEPRTYALIADAIPGGDYLLRDRLARLGCRREDQVVLREEACTLARLQEELRTLRSTLRSHDRLIFYVNGHGQRQGAGAIQLADGYLTSQMLADCLADMPTGNSLVIIDSCFGGKFIRALRGTTDAVVIAGTDTQNVGFATALIPFWRSLVDPLCDVNGDGRVTVEEAFWRAYREMLAEGEQARQHWVGQSEDPRLAEMCAEAGYATPQFAVLGEADPQIFAVAVEPPPAKSNPDSARPESEGR